MDFCLLLVKPSPPDDEIIMIHPQLANAAHQTGERERERGHLIFSFWKTKWVISANLREDDGHCDIVPLLMLLLGVQVSEAETTCYRKRTNFPISSTTPLSGFDLVWLLPHAPLLVMLSLQLQPTRISTKKRTFWLDHSSSSIMELLSWDISTGFCATFLFCLVEVS